MRATLEARLRRLEEQRIPARPLQALTVMARDRADAERQVVEAIAAGRHMPGWPAIIIIASEPCL